MSKPRAPSTPCSSSSGELIAARAASTAAPSPFAVAVPIIAWPMPDMMALMSEKSRLMMPGVSMISEMPWTACRNTSSAILKASRKLVPFGASFIRRSLGIEITVSTVAASSARPRSAWRIRFGPSNLKGIVTTATVIQAQDACKKNAAINVEDRAVSPLNVIRNQGDL